MYSAIPACIEYSLFDVPLITVRRKPNLKRLDSKGKFAFDEANKLSEQSLLGLCVCVSFWAPDWLFFRMVKKNISTMTCELDLIYSSEKTFPLCGYNFDFD